jgi:UDP-glucose:(heptosyl)LPS alpha-1,3-glucosyltransferase
MRPCLAGRMGKRAMKIAFIRNEYDPYGGAEKFTQTLVDSLAQRGVEVHVFARRWIESGNTKVHFHHIGGPQAPSLLRHATFVFFVRRAVRREDFDLIQSNDRTLCQDVYRAGDGVHARWLELRAPHQNYLRRFLVRINPFHHYLLWLERRLFEHPDLKAVIVNSNMVRHEITSRFQIPNERIHTIYNGVDLDRIRPENRLTIGNELRAECGLASEIPVVLFVGSGFERKGLAHLLRGMALAGGTALLWVVGKGGKRPYQRLAQELGLMSRVTFWGPHQDALRFYAAADIFAFPTLYDPFSTAVLEALAAGLPVITTAQCGTAEIMSQGKEGFILSSPCATAELGGYLNDLYYPNRRHIMSANARKRAEAFPLERTIGELQRLYRHLVKNNNT